MVSVHVVRAAALALALLLSAAGAKPLPVYTVETNGTQCRFVSGTRKVTLALKSPCWLATDDAGHPYQRRAASGAGIILLAVASPYHGSFLKPGMERCGAAMQAITVSAAAIRPGKRVERGIQCRGQQPDSAAWWVLEHDPPIRR